MSHDRINIYESLTKRQFQKDAYLQLSNNTLFEMF